MSTTTPTLRPFEKVDFYAFAGMESSEPLINFHGEYAIIVDSGHLEICTQAEDDFQSFVQDYQSAATAENVGNDILRLLATGTPFAEIADRFHLQAI